MKGVLVGEGDEAAEGEGRGETPRIVRLPVVARDAATQDGRPLSDTARAHGGAFHLWIQRCIEASVGAVEASVARPARFARWRARLLGLLRRRRRP